MITASIQLQDFPTPRNNNRILPYSPTKAGNADVAMHSLRLIILKKS